MKVNEILRRIQFKIWTPDDISGKSVNPIIDNKYIIDELNTQLRHYANVTKGIQDIYSFPLQSNTPIIQAPTLALRSEAYIAVFIISRGTIFMMDIRNHADVLNVFRNNPIKGITNWAMPYNVGNKQYINLYPTNSLTCLTTQLTSNITYEDTTIPVVSTAGFIANNGRITIGEEKIVYEYKDTTNFYGCIRGQEMTKAANHAVADYQDVLENNLNFIYSRLPEPIIVTDDNFVPNDVLAREIEVIEEHIEGIVKATAYNLLIKINPERAIPYKSDFDALFERYKKDYRKGYGTRGGTNIREQYPMAESGIPFGTNIAGF